jgi:hypothetical protein
MRVRLPMSARHSSQRHAGATTLYIVWRDNVQVERGWHSALDDSSERGDLELVVGRR